MLIVRPIPPELCYDIRRLALDLPRADCRFDYDSQTGAFHLGGWIGERQMGVCVFAPCREQIRLREILVLPQGRGKGLGTMMLLTGQDRVYQTGEREVSAYAPENAVGFFEKNGWRDTGGHDGGLTIMKKDLTAPRSCSGCKNRRF
jgi:GNAT superfamily N-acetyltransferase